MGLPGSGKTTFLNAIGGLDTPDTGKVIINNTDITQLKSNQLIALLHSCCKNILILT